MNKEILCRRKNQAKLTLKADQKSLIEKLQLPLIHAYHDLNNRTLAYNVHESSLKFSHHCPVFDKLKKMATEQTNRIACLETVSSNRHVASIFKKVA